MHDFLNAFAGPLRQLRWLIISTVFGAIALLILAWILDGFVIEGSAGVIVAAATIAIAQALAWPVVYRFSSWFPAIVFPVIMFVGSGLIILAVSELDDRFGIDQFTVGGLENAIWISLGMTIVTSFLSTLFSLDDRQSYDRFVTGPLRTRYQDGHAPTEPGFLFLEIDGLARPILEDAMKRGYAPTMKRWIAEGSHELTEWEPDLSSQTSASQAGILLGSNENIPAFRWWDKAAGQLMVSSSMHTAQHLESVLSTDTGLLAPAGVSRFNVFSGGAADCVATFSKLRLDAGESSYWAYFANPYTLGRMISLFVQEVVREWWEEFRQNRKNVQPRIARPWTYAFVRAGTTAALLELTRFMCIADIYRGVPSAYYTIFAYDEVAHHTGIDRDDTLRVLRKIDSIFAHLERVAATADRPMHLVVLSDHGQSQGATFRQRYGQDLGELVRSALPTDADVASILSSNEAIAHFDAVIQERGERGERTRNILSRLVENRSDSGTVSLGLEESDKIITESEVVVLASGNLGLISFTRWPERMTLQQIIDAFPSLIPALTEHPGIGLVLVNDEEAGGIVLGSAGTYFLDADTYEGENPLEPYGARAAAHLRRTNAFPAAPDVLVVSTYWDETDEVAAFEELVGNHGGLGGTQQQPFLLYPAEFDAGDEEIVGAAQVNRVLRSWIREAQPGLVGPPPAEPEVALVDGGEPVVQSHGMSE